MHLTITTESITSGQTAHTARSIDPAEPYGSWAVSWLPGRVLDRNQAITAMTLAETVATHELFCDSPWWPVIDGWAAELGLTGPHAVVLTSAPADDTTTGAVTA